MNGLQIQFLMLIFAGWVNRSQLEAIAYLKAENRVLREQLGQWDKAIETYRRMLEFDPDNDGFRRRIEELESVAFNSDVVPALDMSSGHAAAAPDERPTESLAPDEDPGDGTSDDPFPWVSQL